MVPTRPLGATGLTVSAIGLGTVKIGRSTGVKYPTPFDLPDDDQVRALLHSARELGVNFIDTAPAYGQSEHRLGTLLPGPRDRWTLATKTGEQFINGRSRFDFSQAATRANVDESCRRLRTDYLDLVCLHSDGVDESTGRFDEAINALHALKSAGKVRAVGASMKSVEGGMWAVENCDVVMVTLNPDDQAALPVIQAAHKNGTGIIIKKALLSGHLDRLKVTDPAAHCVQFALTATPGVSSVIVGTLNPTHLEDACQAAAALNQD